MVLVGWGWRTFCWGYSYSQSTAFDKNDYSPLHTIFMHVISG